MKLCEYGCGNEAIHQFKSSKKWACSSNVNSCPGKRNKDSIKKKGKNPFEGKIHPKGMLGKKSWNSGLTLKDMNPETANKISIGGKKGGLKSSGKCSDPIKEQERRNKISQKMKAHGGLRIGSGRGKKGWYKGYFCDSSWELAWVIYNLDHNIYFSRNTEKFPYEHEGIQRNFIPDFIMEDGSYVEIKGYVTDQVKSKIKFFPHKIEIIDKTKINTYIEYVEKHYGKDYIKLYSK